MSLTSVWADVGRFRQAKHANANSAYSESCFGNRLFCSREQTVSQARTVKPLRTGASGRGDQRPSFRRAINTSMRRMLAQLSTAGAVFLSKFGDKRNKSHWHF